MENTRKPHKKNSHKILTDGPIFEINYSNLSWKEENDENFKKIL